MEVAVKLRLSYPVMFDAKLFAETSKKYSVAPVTLDHEALNAVEVIPVTAFAVGVAGFINTVIAFELAEVPDELTARKR